MSAEFSVWLFLIEVTVHIPESCPENCTLAFSNQSITIFKRITPNFSPIISKKKENELEESVRYHINDLLVVIVGLN